MTVSTKTRKQKTTDKPSSKRVREGIRAIPITRFAHPFFTNVEPERRATFGGAQRMTDVIQAHLEKIPPVTGKSIMTLADVIGNNYANAIANENRIVFQTFGDSGHVDGRAQQ